MQNIEVSERMKKALTVSGLGGISLVFWLFWQLATPLMAEDINALQNHLNRAKKSGSQTELSNSLIALGDFHRKNSEPEQALVFYEEAYRLAEKRKNTDDLIYVGVNIANVLDTLGKLSEALQKYNEALARAKQAKDQAQLAKIHNNIGNLYLRIGSFAASLSHYQRALEIKQRQKDPEELANALMNLSVFYLKTGNYRRSLDYQFQALELREKGSDQAALAAVYSSISICYRHLKDFQKAFEFNRKALEIQTQLNNTAKIASLYNNLGILYRDKGDLARAKESYLKSYELKKDSADKQSVLASLINLGSLSLDMKQTQECKRWLDRATKLEPELQSYEHTLNLSKLRADYYEQTGDFRSAIAQLKLYQSISDSLSSLASARQLNELEVRYEVEEKQRNIDLLTRNNRLAQQQLSFSLKLRNYLYLILGLSLITMLAVLWRYLSVLKLSKKLYATQADLNSLNRDLEKRVESEVDIRRAQEQKALRQSRLALLGELAAGISHELNQPMQTLSFTLENIKSAILDESLDAGYLERKLKVLFEDIDRMQSVINHIRCFSRPQDENEDSSFNLRQSILNATNMVGDQFRKLGIDMQLDLAAADLKIKGNSIKFEQVILNLLTNARDAIRKRKADGNLQPGAIVIKCFTEETRVGIKIDDNGCGIPKELSDMVFEIFFSTKDQEEGTGLGLAISKSTLAKMNGELSFDSEPGKGTTFSISLPYEKEAK